MLKDKGNDVAETWMVLSDIKRLIQYEQHKFYTCVTHAVFCVLKEKKILFSTVYMQDKLRPKMRL